jgi:cation:H+ antiporter
MEPIAVVLFVVGLILLVAGAERLVHGASRIARTLGVSPVIVGLTVVAYGTSAPEVVVSVVSVLKGQTSLALGNVIGSNIFNVLFILGICALIAPLVVSQRLVRFDVPLVIALSCLLYGFAYSGNVDRLEGAVFVALAVGYTVYTIVQSRRESDAVKTEYAQKYGGARENAVRLFLDVVWIVGGLAGLIVGSGWFVDGAVAVATALGVSELIIGLTIVAAGTSVPEVATSIVASVRGERDIAVGNIIGSSVFNILVVMGAASVVAPNGIPVSSSALAFDLPVMIAVSVACLPIFFTGSLIARWEGGIFLAYYAAYTIYVILDATSHETLPMFSATMLFFALPVTALTLGFLLIRAIWKPSH